MHSRERQPAPGNGPSITVREECRSLEEFYPDPWLRGRLHYAFAHQFLPPYLLRNPRGLRAILTGDRPFDPIRFIQSRWGLLEQEVGLVPPAESQPLFSEILFRRVTDLEAWVEPVAGKFAFFVQMPPPPPLTPWVGPRAHAYFTGVVCLSESEARYFTLERRVEDSGEQSRKEGLLCEWTADGAHHNYGQLVDPQRSLFVAAVAAVVENGEHPVAGVVPGGSMWITGRPAPGASGPAPGPSGEPVLPLRLGCIIQGWRRDLGIEIRSEDFQVVVHDYPLAIPAKGVRATSVVCAHCRKPVEVEVRSPPEVTQYRWVMFGLAVAVPMLLVAVGKLLARWWWPSDAHFVPMPFALFLLGLFLEGVVLARVLAPSDLIHFAVRTRGHARFHCAEAEWQKMDPLATPPEPVPCLECGATIPANRKRCSKCGWSYAVGEAGASS